MKKIFSRYFFYCFLLMLAGAVFAAPSISQGGNADGNAQAYLSNAILSLQLLSGSPFETSLADVDGDGAIGMAEAVIGLRMAGGVTGDGSLVISNYYPKSGPVRSWVLLKTNELMLDLDEPITVYYAGEPLDDDLIQIANGMVGLILPETAASGNIQLRSGSYASNMVPFTVLPTTLTPLLSQTVSPSSVNQTFRVNDEIAVTIPPGILDSPRTLTIQRVENSPPNLVAPFAPVKAYDVSIEGLEQLNDYIEIQIPYNPEELNPDMPAADQFSPMRWNEMEKYWLALPYQVDAEHQTVKLYTDHLSIVGTITITGLVIGNLVTWSGVGEELLNDTFFTPSANFKLMYSKTAIQSDATLEDSAWSAITYSGPIYPITAYQTGTPKFIQDMGHLLETALNNYVSVLHFKDPITKPGLLWGTTRNPITVKMDSWWSSISGNPNYEKIFEYVHYPTIHLKDYTAKGFSYGALGHELFHRLQAEYYGMTGFLNPYNTWWIEASAEYAGYRAAWPGRKFEGLHDKTGYDFLSHPISKTGLMPVQNGWGSEANYEYAASAFVQFLVEKKGLDFKDLIEHVAKGWPLEQLNGYKGVTLSQYYKEFAAWGIFGDDSFLKRHPISAIAAKNESLSVSDGRVKVSFTGGNFSGINIYKLDKNYARSAVIPSPERNLMTGESHEMDVENDDMLYLMAVNPGGEDETITVSVELMANGEAQPGAVYIMNLKGGYSAKLWAIQISAPATGKPFTVNREWQRSYWPSWYPETNKIDFTATVNGKVFNAINPLIAYNDFYNLTFANIAINLLKF